MTATTIRRANQFAREDRRAERMRKQAVFKPVTTPPRGAWRNLRARFNRYRLATIQPRTGASE